MMLQLPLGYGEKRICVELYLEALILKNLLDGSIITVTDKPCLKHDSKGSVANHLAVGVGKFERLSGLALIRHHLDDFRRIRLAYINKKKF